MGRLDGKVVFVTGAARGQGRSHAVRFAEEGADVIAVDLCAQMDTVDYPMATPEDLAETIAQVEALDRRIVARQADVRDQAALATAVRDGVAELGRLDFVLANAGIGVLTPQVPDPIATFRDVVDVNLTGVWNTVVAAAPTIVEQGEGGAIVITSSTAGLKGTISTSPGGLAYTASKHGVVGLMRAFANLYAPDRIRCNSIHPTGVDTPMVNNDTMQRLLLELDGMSGVMSNLLPVELTEPVDISNAMVFLCSEEGRYITGVTLPVDAGFTAK